MHGCTCFPVLSRNKCHRKVITKTKVLNNPKRVCLFVAWNNRELQMLEQLHPSLERLLGETPFPPDEKVVEGFIDALSVYGFHGFSWPNWDGIDRLGLKLPIGATYFIADRTISEEPYYEREQERCEIGASEYMARFENSIQLVAERIVFNHYDWQMGILVINREKFLPTGEEFFSQNKEWRGSGFLGDAMALWRTPVLDEGYLSIPEGYLPRSSIIGRFECSGKHPIAQFYEIAVQHFLDKAALPVPRSQNLKLMLLDKLE